MRHQKTKEKDKKDNGPQIREFKIEEENKESSQGSGNSWFSSWSSMTFDSPKSKKRKIRKDDKEKTNGGAHFTANRETKVKVNHFSLPKRPVQANHLKQQTYQHKLVLIRTIIKMMTKMIARWSFLLK